MTILRFRTHNTIFLATCIVFCSLLLIPASGASQEVDPEQLRQMIQNARPQRPKTGRNIVQALQAEKKYTTFLAIVDRAGLTALLQGTVSDTTTPMIIANEDSLSSRVNVNFGESNLPEDADTTQIKSQIFDQVRTVVEDAMLALIAEEGRITVFAPTDDAFNKLPKARQDSLRTNPTAAAQFVRAHIVNRGVYRDALGKLRSMTPLAGPGLQVNIKSPGATTINGSKVADRAIAADNGVAYGIDTVLDPRAPASDGSVVPKKA